MQSRTMIFFIFGGIKGLIFFSTHFSIGVSSGKVVEGFLCGFDDVVSNDLRLHGRLVQDF